ncbi:hypothetical protein KUL72_21200 [Bradyrhizobium arachidis]|uniref:hypothetical protein n=1 Tax=Bradyrhizobium arachidis TaxID=858423 RepID=UPI00216369BE|nr:hypothetical protein [Bradyrhizobium arachidis]UVO34029.1 hypothetical protein KUL72_21200 [Bradyrhizobium arachidis]
MRHLPRFLLALAGSVLLLGAGSVANADIICGPGCHPTIAGVCVVDGWGTGARVRNECPATSRPRPPCGGSDYVWSQRKQACFPKAKDWI